jgi:hypothetical protein
MFWLRTLGYGILFLFIFYILIVYTNTIEPFVDSSTTLSQDVTTLMTQGSEIFCPAINEILNTMESQYSGTDEEKRASAKLALVKEANGAMFPCPVPADPLATPADIDKRILLSRTFLRKKMVQIKADIQKNLDCPTKEGFQSAYEEGFENVCSGEEELQKEDIQRKEAAIQATKTCISPKGLSQEDKQKILEYRLDALKRAMGEPSVAREFAEIKSLTVEIKDLKEKAVKGDLKTNCPN